VALRLFRSPEEALQATRSGVPRLAECLLQRDLVWLQKDLRSLNRCRTLYVTLGPVEELLEGGWINLRRHLLPGVEWSRLTQAQFDAYLARARERIPGIAQALGDRVLAALEKRQEALLCRKPLPRMRVAIDALVPPRFLEHVDYERLIHLPRYLQALLVRAERAAVHPAKDLEKWRRVEPFVAASAALKAKAAPGKPAGAAERFRWLLEEFKVSVFAQELGTAEPVSERRLSEALTAAS
jgi:ATP-dependent helicase HrpA